MAYSFRIIERLLVHGIIFSLLIQQFLKVHVQVELEEVKWTAPKQNIFKEHESPHQVPYRNSKKQPQRTCQRSCPNERRNKIVIVPHPKFKAGFNDRWAILDYVGNLAGYLCAIMVVPSPRLFLSPRHNHGRTLSSNVTWDDFMNLTWIDYNETMKSYEPSSSSSSSSSPYMSIEHCLEWPRNASHPYCHNSSWIQHDPEDEKQGSVLVVRSGQLHEPYNHFRFLESWTFHTSTYNKPFVWYIQIQDFYGILGNMERLKRPLDRLPDIVEQLQRRTNIIDKRNTPITSVRTITEPFRLEMRPSMFFRTTILHQNDNTSVVVEPCPYMEIKNPDHSERLKNQIWQNIQKRITRQPPAPMFVRKKKSQPLIGMLHVRRTDAERECNTTMDKLKQYLSCSFLDDRQRPPAYLSLTRTILILFASDEQNPHYRQEVMTYLNQELQVQVIDLDEFLQEQLVVAAQQGLIPWRLATDNNFYLFHLEAILRANVDFNLVQRRGMYCHECDNIVTSLSQ